MSKKKIAVIGGGAAGMMAAIGAAKKGAEVTIFERNGQIGKKVLVTGNGKCNFSNLDLRMEHYYDRHSNRMNSFFKRFGVDDTLALFRGVGMVIREKNGYLYPASEQASIVPELLGMELQALQVKIQTDRKVNDIVREEGNKKIRVTSKGEGFDFDRVIIACGGAASPKTGSDGTGYYLAEKLGHTIIPVVPALVQLKCKEECLKSVAGVRAEASIKLMIDGEEVAKERGELQLTDYGISGIAVFQLGRHVSYALLHKRKVEVSIDFFPDMGEEDYKNFMVSRRITLSDRTAEAFFAGILNKKLMNVFINKAGIQPNTPMDMVQREKIEEVFRLCRSFKLQVIDTSSFDSAQVSAGGVAMEEVSDNLESLKVPGVFFAGEILDVDGKCGGYNLQWAWSSGYIAGESAATI